jgi:hypothetical protein
MKAVWLAVAACSAPAAPVVSNARVAPVAPGGQVVTCGSFEDAVRCFATHAACTAELANCADVGTPQWSCARSMSAGMTTRSLDLCLPLPALCAHDLENSQAHREPCRPVPEVYCRGGSELICHPTREICEQEVKSLVSFGGEPSTCVHY